MSSKRTIRAMWRALSLPLVVIGTWTSTCVAQNMPHEVGIWGAHQGQLRLERESESNRGFFQNPDIGHVYFNFLSNGLQSLAVFLETVSESRTRQGQWTDVYFGNQQVQYPAEIREHVGVTVIGLETSRTLLRLEDLRVAGIVGIGYGFGGTTADVTKAGTDTTKHYESAFDWQAFELSFAVRLRYSVYITNTLDVGVIAGIRYWGYPYLGPLSPSTNYNGPDFRNSNDIGYIAGIAIGF